MIDTILETTNKIRIQNILCNFKENFEGLGIYHLDERVGRALEEIINLGVVEEHPTDELAPWISCAVITPKLDGDIRLTLDARNLNKALLSTNLPNPRHEDIR